VPIWRKQLNNPSDQSKEQRLKSAKKDLLIKGLLAVFTVAVTMILIFAMTAAWFTNVVSTDGLTFQVESWGFDGGVVVNQDVIKAAPGSQGYLSMQITNTGEKNSRLSVGISKAFMPEDELRQRIFFYAETSSVINEEYVERIYLNETNAYTYYLPAQNEIILSEQVYTDVRLKWEWVYDVVGYYFRGNYDGNAFVVEEYLRPAEYDYDSAQFDADGRLVKVDANTDVYQYLANLTAGDGYPGAFTVQTDSGTGQKQLMQDGHKVTAIQECYPIDAANNVWLYLCTRQEIQSNTAWDTQFGMSAQQEQKNFQVRIRVIGEQFEQEVLDVSSQSDLEAALSSGGNQLITLQQDLTLTKPLSLAEGARAEVDLNGYRLTCNDSNIFSVPSDAKLTLLDGTLSGDGSKTIAIKTLGGQVTMSKMTIENVMYALEVNDYNTKNPNGDNSFVRILDSYIDTDDVAIYITGDGSRSEERTALVVQNSDIRSGYIAILGNGTISGNGRWGTDVQIVNSQVYGYYAGVYQPQMRSTTTVSGSTVSGWTGIALKGGDLVVLDSNIMGLATDAEAVVPTENQLGNSGFIDTGDGIYVEDSYGYPMSVTVSGTSKVTSTAQSAQAVRVFPETGRVKVSITSGTFGTDVSAYLQAGYLCTKTEEGYVVGPQQ